MELEKEFIKIAKSLRSRELLFQTTINQLEKMKKHDKKTYVHELRVALIAARLAKFSKYRDIRPEFFGGANHDAGKLAVNKNILKSKDITLSEYEKIKKHVEIGHKNLLPHMFTAAIAGSHHSHQLNSYGVQPVKNFGILNLSRKPLKGTFLCIT